MFRISSLLKNIICSNFMRLSSPYKIVFAVTYKCNLKCKICKIWERASMHEMDIAAIEKVFKSLGNLNWLDLTGGEITLREDIIDIVKVILKNSRRLAIFHVSTNGQLPDAIESIVKEIKKSPAAAFVNVSLDGPRHIHDKLRGVPGAYERSIETFIRLRKILPARCFLSCTISQSNITYIDMFLEDLRKDIPDFDFANLHFNLVHSSSHYYNVEETEGTIKLDPAVIQKYFSLAKRGSLIKCFLENEYSKELSRHLNGERVSLACLSLSATCFIDPSGRVFPCGRYKEVVGDLADNDYNFKRLWNDPKTLAVRNKIEKKECPGCWGFCEAYPAILGSVGNRFFGKARH